MKCRPHHYLVCMPFHASTHAMHTPTCPSCPSSQGLPSPTCMPCVRSTLGFHTAPSPKPCLATPCHILPHPNVVSHRGIPGPMGVQAIHLHTNARGQKLSTRRRYVDGVKAYVAAEGDCSRFLAMFFFRVTCDEVANLHEHLRPHRHWPVARMTLGTLAVHEHPPSASSLSSS